jgi:CheY-like chemotaxis protein
VFSVRRQAGAGAAPAAQPGAAVLIADEPRPFRDALQRAVQGLGVRCAVVEDGEAALRYVQEQRPRLLLVNVYLRKLLGVIVCERVKADPVLRSTQVILIGSLFRQDRFVRQPDRDRLYGADDYIEEAIEPEDLRQRLQALLSPALAPAAAPSAALAPQEDLQRLIRIILSDILVYYPERCETAVREGRFVQEFRVELEEGRRLVTERFAGLPQVAEIYRRAVHDWAEERRQAHVG